MRDEVIDGRYELEELVGSGGMSSVYRAHDRLLERKVALKILHQRYVEDAEYVERFRREARAVAQLTHPNIVTVIDRGEEGGRQFIVFEYIEGESLKDVLQRSGPLPIGRAIEYGLQIAQGLAYAHGQGLVHRDVKPQNVLLNGDGRAKVMDFGIARSLDVERGVTQTGTVLGTSNYIAPEQASGQPVDERSDVYSLGVVLFELLTGELPFVGESFVAVAMQHVHEPPPSVLSLRPETPPRLAQLVDAMLTKDHNERPAMDEVVTELEALRSPTVATDETMVVRPRPKPRRRPRRLGWPLVLAAIGAVLLGVAFGALLLRDEVPQVPAVGDGGEEPAITLRATGTVDPRGDGEHDGEVGNAVDKNPATAWRTQTYNFPNGEFGKEGVGIVVEASRAPSAVVVQTDTPGFTAEIRAGNEAVSASRQVAGQTTFELADGTDATELTVWITNRGPNAAVHVNEVTAR